jgi:hypothetical protein
MNDFSATTIRRLARRGIRVLRPVAIPDMTSDLPFANAGRGYSVDDNGTGRVWTFAQVVAAAA